MAIEDDTTQDLDSVYVGHLLGQPAPKIHICEGFERPLLAPGNDLAQASYANGILNLQHSQIDEHQSLFPFSAISAGEFHGIYGPHTPSSLNASVFLRIESDPDHPAILTIHPDGSALIWRHVNEESFAPLPEAFRLDIPVIDGSVAARLPQIPIASRYNEQGHELGQLIEHFVRKRHLSTPSHWDRTPLTWDGSTDIVEALQSEVRQWVEWSHTAQRPLLGPTRTRDGIQGTAIYPWSASLYTQSHEQLVELHHYTQAILDFIAKHEGLDPARLQRSSLQGRYFVAKDKISHAGIDLRIASMKRNEEYRLSLKWKGFVQAAFDGQLCPVPPINQIGQYARRSMPLTSGSIRVPYPEKLAPPSSHQIIQNQAALQSIFDTRTDMKASLSLFE